MNDLWFCNSFCFNMMVINNKDKTTEELLSNIPKVLKRESPCIINNYDLIVHLDMVLFWLVYEFTDNLYEYVINNFNRIVLTNKKHIRIVNEIYSFSMSYTNKIIILTSNNFVNYSKLFRYCMRKQIFITELSKIATIKNKVNLLKESLAITRTYLYHYCIVYTCLELSLASNNNCFKILVNEIPANNIYIMELVLDFDKVTKLKYINRIGYSINKNTLILSIEKRCCNCFIYIFNFLIRRKTDITEEIMIAVAKGGLFYVSYVYDRFKVKFTKAAIDVLMYNNDILSLNYLN